jgi:hypothetical protein
MFDFDDLPDEAAELSKSSQPQAEQVGSKEVLTSIAASKEISQEVEDAQPSQKTASETNEAPQAEQTNSGWFGGLFGGGWVSSSGSKPTQQQDREPNVKAAAAAADELEVGGPATVDEQLMQDQDGEQNSQNQAYAEVPTAEESGQGLLDVDKSPHVEESTVEDIQHATAEGQLAQANVNEDKLLCKASRPELHSREVK